MKLRTKLILGVGFLFVALVAILSLLPTFLVKRDVYLAAEQIHALLIDEHERFIKSQREWLSNELRQTQETIDSLLTILHKEPLIGSSITFTPGKSSVEVWEALARVVSFDPAIGFIQAHVPGKGETAVLQPHAAHFYETKKAEAEHFTVYEESGPVIYFGKPITTDAKKGYTLYLLFDRKKAPNEQLASSSITGNSPSYFWRIKIEMMETLLSSLGKDESIEGIVRVDTSGNGLALLKKDLFQTAPLFNDQLYYETHPPKSESLPLASGVRFIIDEQGSHVFIANTLLEKNTFITLGIPFRELLRQLALSSNITILLKVKEDFWIGFDQNGEKLPPKQIQHLQQAGMLGQERGKFSIDKDPYYFDLLASLNEGELKFYEVYPLRGEQSIIATLFDLENRLSGKISLQLSLVALGVMLLFLLFIIRLGYTIIQPISKLAGATEEVVAGNYHAVSLPNVGRRKDEVATLTRAFGEMVDGLEEREKIRAVLDKVVSKDVADEILRTKIHLGGEDRIVTMLFGDIRGFTEITRSMTPQKTIEMLNGCMTRISRVIEGEGGIIDKYVGDEVMALFGAPAAVADHALRAVSTGMLMIETLKKWNEERLQRNEPLAEMGIGVHSGLVVAGNMGAEDRLNYTVLGANVNLASRLCSMAKPGQLLISEATLLEPHVKDSFFVQALEPILLKGFLEPVMIYQVTGFKWETT